MPSKHKYKCLSPKCKSILFIAMTSPSPSCPACGCLKNEDWGVADGPLGYYRSPNASCYTSSGVAKRSDQNLRRIADKYGLTDMNNKDGQAVKRAAAPPPASPKGEKVSIGGFQVDANSAASSGCTRLAVTSKLSGPQIQGVNTNKSPMLKGMTRVVATDKGRK